MNSIAALKCRVLIENVSTITDLSDGEESDLHDLLEEVISQLSTPFVTEISQNFDTTVKEKIDQLKRPYVVTKFQTDVNHTLLELYANDSLMVFVSSHKQLFIPTYDNTRPICTSEKIKSKHWNKFHAAIHSYIISESYIHIIVKGTFQKKPVHCSKTCVWYDYTGH